MRFKKGSKVEVLDEREVPSGSWCCAEIVSGNRHYYSVKYDSFSEGTGVTVERVPRKAIRPCPPLVMSPRCWVPGDIVEVYEKNSWKVAEVSRVIGRTCFLVRLLGSSRKLRAHISDLRMRLVWEDDKWVVIQKEPGERNFVNTNNLHKAVEFSDQMPLSCIDVKRCQRDDQILNKHDSSPGEYCWVALGSKRRRSCLDSPQIDSCPSACKEMRSVDETERKCRLLETLPSHLLRKVDVGAPPQTIHGAKLMHTSLDYGKSGFHETEMDEGTSGHVIGCDFLECLESDDAKSTCSSVGSCSVSDGTHRSLHYSMSSQDEGTDSYYDDVASSHGSGRESSLPAQEGLPEEVHCLEVNAYRSTLVALYASGPLSWEQEILLTNLRLMLHISNEEHLLELKQLTGARNRYL